MTLIASLPCAISAPGRYELAGDLSTSGTAITVTCSDVTIDLQGHTISGPRNPALECYGIASFNHERLVIRNGALRGFMYGIYLSDLIDSVRPNGSFDGGMHLIEDVNVANCFFRGVRVEGNGNIVRRTVVREIGGCTVYQNAYGFGIESCGPGAMIEGNRIYECRGFGIADIGEGVGISVSDYGRGSVIRDNVLAQSTREPHPQYADWPGASRSSYGIWIGGDSSDVVVDGNVLTNFVYGITFKRTSSGVFTRNVVNNAVVPIYLPNADCNKYGALARDGGGNLTDVRLTEMLPMRVTPGPIEYVEKSYLAPRA